MLSCKFSSLPFEFLSILKSQLLALRCDTRDELIERILKARSML